MMSTTSMGNRSFDDEMRTLKSDAERTLEAAQEELMELVAERMKIDRTITELQQNIAKLAALCDKPVEDPWKQIGMTDAIRHVIGTATEPVSPTKLADVLDDLGVKLPENLWPSLHTVLKRLERAKEIKNDDGGYVWTGKRSVPSPPVPDLLSFKVPIKSVLKRRRYQRKRSTEGNTQK